MNYCGDDQSKLERARQQIYDAYGSDPNVTGVGIGFRRRAGVTTEEPAVVVLVAKKRREALVSRRRLLPRTVEVDSTTYQVDVIQAGPFSSGAQTALAPARAAAGQEITERMRPPRQGASVSNPVDGVTAGTLGLFVVDNTDDTVCVLTCNHVIARMGRGKVGEAIIQPGAYDGGTSRDKIATLKRWAPMPAAGTKVDGAIAQLTDQDAYTLEVAQDLMPPVSADHPVVGMVAAGDSFGACLLTRMDLTLDALDVRLPIGQASASTSAAALPCAGPGTGIADPQPGMAIEKVGRTTGYTSSTIVAIGVQAPVSTPIGTVMYQDLIYTEFFSSAGDSGSVVFAGGDGKTQVPGGVMLECVVLGSLSDYYRLPLREENPLADKVRDEFFLESLTGKLLVELTYVNSQSLVDRLKDRQGRADEVAYANQYYTKYRDFMAGVLDDPDSPEVVTQEHLDDASFIITGLVQTVLTADESKLALTLYRDSLVPTLGMNRREVYAYMNNPAVYGQVHDAVAAAPDIEMNAPFKHMEPEPTE
ncbi:hypothetical protein [Actinomadura rifamycini]|uniref:hypothetical protein n=1 Tax=Actinomadura rifamycini TaxID=31962 RepID=UPI00040AFB2A|nr:hypothetical protein [Actinomadura rifamycini]